VASCPPPPNEQVLPEIISVGSSILPFGANLKTNNKMNLLKQLEMANIKSKIDLNSLSIEELNKVIADANRLLRLKEYESRVQRKEAAKTNLKIGDIVTVSSKRFDGEIWEVLKLNPKKVKCKRENGEVWHIPYSNIIIN